MAGSVIWGAALLASCAETDTCPGQSGASSAADYARDIGSLTHVDQQRAVTTLCAAWQSNRGDNQSINDYVANLLAPLERINEGKSVPSQAAIDDAVRSACANSPADRAKFVVAIARDLHLSTDDFRSRVDEACVRYRTRLANDKASGYSGNKDLDPFIRDVAAKTDIGDSALRTAVDAICPKR